MSFRVRPLIFGLVLLGLLVWAASSYYVRRDWFEVNRAEYALVTGDYDDAVLRLEGLFPSGGRYRNRVGLMLADAFIQSGDYSAAREYLDKLRESALRSYLSGLVALDTSSTVARAHFEDAIRLDVDKSLGNRGRLATLAVAGLDGDFNRLVQSDYWKGRSRLSESLPPADLRLSRYLLGCRFLALTDFSGAARLFDRLDVHGLRNGVMMAHMATAKAMDLDFAGASFYLDDDSTEAMSEHLQLFKSELTKLKALMFRPSYSGTEATRRRSADDRVVSTLAWANLYHDIVIGDDVTSEAVLQSLDMGVPKVSIAELLARSGRDREAWEMACLSSRLRLCRDAELLAADLAGGSTADLVTSYAKLVPGLMVFDVDDEVPQEWEAAYEGEVVPWECRLVLDVPADGHYRISLFGKSQSYTWRGIGVSLFLAQSQDDEGDQIGRMYFAHPFYGVQSVGCDLPAGRVYLKFRFNQTHKQGRLYLNKIFVEKTEDML